MSFKRPVRVDAGRILAAQLAPSGAPLTLRRAAICAVMAGCTLGRFPLVLVAIDAMTDPAYKLNLSNIATHPSGNLLLFRGPAAKQAGIASGRCSTPSPAWRRRWAATAPTCRATSS